MMADFPDSRVILSIAVGAAFAIVQWALEIRNRTHPNSRKIVPIVTPIGLMSMCVTAFIFSLIIPPITIATSAYWSAYLLLQAGIYYTLLFVLHPLLRRFVSGTGRAVLWVLPNAWYFGYFLYQSAQPSWVVPIDREWLVVFLTLWLCGALLVMMFQILDHDRFRREILQNAHEPTAAALAILRAEEKRLLPQQEYTLVVSPDVRTPLSIGITDKSLRIVLPERDYTDEELTLILRHELVHIKRKDSGTKLFLAICTALSWFNPFVWLSRRCACEDFESGCDELVLTGADEATRKQYAGLVLDAAADARGFTTCLSADAASLRNRLRDVVKPGRKLIGCVLTGLMVFLLFFTSGRVAVAYDAQSGRTVLFQDASAEEVSYTQLTFMDGYGYFEAPVGRFDRLTEYLSGLRLYSITTDYVDYGDDSHSSLLIKYDLPEEAVTLRVFDRTVTVYGDRARESQMYYLSKDVDWEYLLTLSQYHPGYSSKASSENQQLG